MAKEVVVLNVQGDNLGHTIVQYVMWLPVATGQEQILTTGTVSLWTGASTSENQAIQLGQVIEEVYTELYPNNLTKAQIQADLVSRYTARNTAFQARPNPKQFYGVFFDSVSGWSA